MLSSTTRTRFHGGELSMLWHTKEGSDITIRCGDGVELKAHRTVLGRFPWMACVFDLQRTMDSDSRYIQLQERVSVIRPLLAFCYGIQLPPLTRGPKSEAQLRNLIDLYHINDSKYHIPKLDAACEAALADLDEVAESTTKLGEKSPMHGVVSRMLGHERETTAGVVQEFPRMSQPDRRVVDPHTRVSSDGVDHHGVALQEIFGASPRKAQLPLGNLHDNLRHGDFNGRESASTNSSVDSPVRGRRPTATHRNISVDNDLDRTGIPIPGTSRMARLRTKSPGGTLYSSPRLYDEILFLLGSEDERSPMLDAAFRVGSLRASFSTEYADSEMPWGMSTSPFEDQMTPPEDTLHLIPGPLRPTIKKKSSITGLFGPRPLPPGRATKRSITSKEAETKALMERPSNTPPKESVFSSLRGATRRAFQGGRYKN